jgi:hypothetical protein
MVGYLCKYRACTPVLFRCGQQTPVFFKLITSALNSRAHPELAQTAAWARYLHWCLNLWNFHHTCMHCVQKAQGKGRETNAKATAGRNRTAPFVTLTCARATTSYCAARMSTSLPLPSSPHCVPKTTATCVRELAMVCFQSARTCKQYVPPFPLPVHQAFLG